MAGKSLYDDSHIIDDEPYRRLWCAVMLTAVQDMERDNADGKRARAFLMDKSEEPRSLNWICFMLDLDPRVVQTKSLSKEGRRELVEIFDRGLWSKKPKPQPEEEDQSSLEASTDAFGW